MTTSFCLSTYQWCHPGLVSGPPLDAEKFSMAAESIAKRRGRPLAIIMADIDFFKLYNDTFGHQEGDECLNRIAKAMESKIVRAGDLLARYGGEEFVCILPDTDLVGAKILAEAMRKAVLALKIPHPTSTVSEYVTISFGIGVIHKIKDESSRVLLHAADAALYHAKSMGRNCVESAKEI